MYGCDNYMASFNCSLLVQAKIKYVQNSSNYLYENIKLHILTVS